MPSRRAARAIAWASIGSLLPRVRSCRRVPALNFGATRAMRSPAPIKKRSSPPETCRQSSIAQTRSWPRPRAHYSSARKPGTRAGAWSTSNNWLVVASTAAQQCVFLWTSVSMTIICGVLSFTDDERTADGQASIGAGPLSYQVTSAIPVAAANDRTRAGHSTTGGSRVSSSSLPGTQAEESDAVAPAMPTMTLRRFTRWRSTCCGIAIRSPDSMMEPRR